MLKRWLSGALATTMLLAGANVFADSVENDIQIVNYKNGKETRQEYLPGRYANQDSPAVPPSTAEIDDTIDPEVYDSFKRAGLIDSDGNFDWEAYGALPTLDEEKDKKEIESVDYKNGKETRQEYLPGRYANQDSPAVPPSTAEIDDTIDPEVYDSFKRAGLIDSDGNFDWEACGELPTLDEEIETYNVIDRDDRISVGIKDEPPYYYTAFLLIKYPSSSGYFRGTGFVAGEGVLATAGHNVYNSGHGGWAEEVTVILQRDENNYPHGTTMVTQFRSNSGWVDYQNTEDDWALIETAKDLSDYVGYCGIVNPDKDIVGEIIELPGYPREVRNETNSYEMWTDTGTVLKQNADNEVYYDADTSGGNSGSGVFINTSSAIAIHAYGTASGNHGARIQGLLYETLQEYRR